jgi:hypothetical protein
MFDVSKQQNQLKLVLFGISKQTKPIKPLSHWLLAGKVC